MKIYAQVKKLGTSYANIQKHELILVENCQTVAQFIEQIVIFQLQKGEHPTGPIIALNKELQRGKVRFEQSKIQVEVKEAITTAKLAFRDGLYAIFHEEQLLEDLEQQIDLAEGDTLTFIRFTFMKGK
ncbi:MAG: hypothetical protein ACRCWQ_06495 [Bacilli bacterium]